LHALDVLVELHPHARDLRFARACLLEDLGRLGAARREYAALIAVDPNHRGALINAATMAYVEGRTTEALGLYRRAAAAHPGDPAALVNLGNVLADTGAWDESRASYERALAADPDHAIAHYVLARLLDERGDPSAATHRARAFAAPLVHVTPSSSASPRRVLMPIAANGGNLVTTLVAESYRPACALPAHDLIVNAVADADRSGDALDAVAAIVAASGRPCINPPAAVRATGRVAMTRRLRDVPGVVVPRTERFARADCTPATLAAAGFTYPLLLRAPGFHAGRYFVRVTSPADVPAQRDGLPGDELLAIAFVDTRHADGRYRKYRMLAIDGELVPLHLALARQWKVHYFRADNAVRAASRTLEADYLRDPRAHLGASAYAALERVRDALALDYGGIDFTLDDAGNVVVFEANASFAIYLPDDDATAAHRRPFADAAIAAVRAMIRRRASGGQQVVREDRSFDDGKDLAPT